MSKTSKILLHVLMPVYCFMVALAFYLKTYDSATIKISMTQIGGVILIALFLLRRIETGFSLTKDEFLFILPALLFWIWGNFSYFHFSAYREWGPYSEWIKRNIYFGLFLVAFFEFRSLASIRNFFYWILTAALLSCLYGIIQWQGLDPFAWKGAFGRRIFSTFGNPNFFGAWLNIPNGLALALFLKKKNWFYLLVFLISALNIYHTRTKAAYLAFNVVILSAGILAALYFFHLDQKKVIRKIITGTLLILLVTVSLVVTMIKKSDIKSVRFRVLTWMGTLEMWKKHPVRGTGIGSFKILYPLYRPPEIFDIEGKHNTETDDPENEYLDVLYEEGIIGLAFLLWFLFGMYKVVLTRFNSWRATLYPRLLEKKHFLLGWTAGITGFLAEAFVCVNSRFVSSGHIMWVAFGIIGALSFQEKPGEDSRVSSISKKPLILPALRMIIIVLAVYLSFFFRRFFIADIHHNMAIAYSKAGQWEEALKNYDKVITLWPDFVMAHYFMGNVYNDRWDMRKTWNPVWDKDVKDPRNDAERSIAKYDDVKRIAPNYVQTHYQVGTVYTKLNDWDRSIENFQKSLDLDPKFPLTYFKIGWCFVQKQLFEEAELAYRGAVDRNPDFTQAYTNLANILFMRKKTQEAEELYKKAISLEPRDLSLYLNLVSFYKEQNQREKARAVCLEILRNDPNNQKVQEVLRSL